MGGRSCSTRCASASSGAGAVVPLLLRDSSRRFALVLEKMGSVLNPDQARAVYDRVGRGLDLQACYEHEPVDNLLAHARLPEARAVLELGCGTGRVAVGLLAGALAPTYLGLDISPVQVGLARQRVARWAPRARVAEADVTQRLPVEDASVDRVFGTYLLDLLASTAIEAVLAEAHRVLEPGGLLCLTSLAHGATPWARAVTTIWERVWRHAPALLGGCRPIDLRSWLGPPAWQVDHQAVVTSCALSSQVLIAEKAHLYR